jgi:hypothetical protein
MKDLPAKPLREAQNNDPMVGRGSKLPSASRGGSSLSKLRVRMTSFEVAG